MNITWEDPPQRAPATSDTDEFLEALQAEPGRWAIAAEAYPAGSMIRIRRALEHSGLEVTAVPLVLGGAFRIYARWPAAA